MTTTAMNNTPNINDLPDEVLVNIIGMLYSYQIFLLMSVNKRLRTLIKNYIFKVSFNPEYTNMMSAYINSYWASITKPLSILQSHYNISDYINSTQYYTTPKQDAQQANRIEIVKLLPNGSSRAFLGEFKECFKQFHILLRADILPYIVLNEMNNSFFNVVMNMSMSPRGTDGLYATLKKGHYSFENIFSYFVAQVIFALLDGIIPLEKRLRKSYPAHLTTEITRQSNSVIYKQALIYCVRIPRHKIFAATAKINYDEFFSSLRQSEKKRLTRMLVTAQIYIDTCRECEGLRDPPSFDVFVNQSFTVKKTKTSCLYFELTDKVRIASSGEDVYEEGFPNIHSDDDDDSDGI